MKKLIVLVFILSSVIQINGQVVTGLQPGLVSNSYNVATVTSGNGTTFALPAQATQITWQISYATAPASITVNLQTSLDNSNFFTSDTSSNVSGEIRTIYSSARFIRCNISASSGGTGITCAIIAKVGAIAQVSSSGVNTVTSNTFLAGEGLATAPSYSFANKTTKGLYSLGGNSVAGSAEGVQQFRWDNGNFDFTGAAPLVRLISDTATLTFGANADTQLTRDAPNILALRNGTNAQSFKLYNTFTDASNYERMSLESSAGGRFAILTEQAGSGVPRQLIIGTIGAAPLTFRTNFIDQWTIDSTGNFTSIGVLFAALGTPSNGSIIYCPDCTIANPCAGGGTGAFAKRLNGIWICN